MLATKPTTRKRLVGVVNALTEDWCLREDLMQEAMIHFWKMEHERPGQTLSWYLQSCSFHLRHYLASGKSIDASKRRSLQIELSEDEESYNSPEWPPVELSVLGQVSVRECMHLLPRYLTPRERAILRCLAEGFKPREIARHLLLSHPTVNKCRRRIAALAARLGIGRSADQSNGSNQLSDVGQRLMLETSVVPNARSPRFQPISQQVDSERQSARVFGMRVAVEQR